MHIEYNGNELLFNVKSKIEDLFKKFPFLSSPPKPFKHKWQEAPYLVDFEKPPLDDDPLDGEEALLKDNFASIVGSCLYFSTPPLYFNSPRFMRKESCESEPEKGIPRSQCSELEKGIYLN